MGYSEKEIISIVLIGSFATLLLVAFLVSFVYFYQRRHFAFLREKQQIQSQFQEELLKTQLEIQEETFRTISQEIHDNIGQTLSFIKLNLNTINPTLTESQEGKWRESKELLTKVIQELRNLSRSLNTDFIQEIGLVSAVRQQLDLLERTGLYLIELETTGDAWILPADTELVLYRVIQELLNNIVKHAEASSIRVSMHTQDQLLTVEVSDNGKGFEPDKVVVQDRPGIGLRNIINRISLIGGTATIDSAAGAGSRITIRLSRSTNQ
jgi:two-component system NarL family sensor kinase